MGYVASIFIVVAVLLVGRKLRQTAKSLVEYRDRCGTQLSDLISHLRQRHLVMSHLLDQLEPSSGNYQSTTRFACDRALKSIEQVDPAVPNPPSLYQLADYESEVTLLAEEMLARYEDYDGNLSRSLKACLDGLITANKQIFESASTYNTSVITYRVYLNSTSAISRRIHSHADHRELDFSPMPSSDSANTPPLRRA